MPPPPPEKHPMERERRKRASFPTNLRKKIKKHLWYVKALNHVPKNKGQPILKKRQRKYLKN